MVGDTVVPQIGNGYTFESFSCDSLSFSDTRVCVQAFRSNCLRRRTAVRQGGTRQLSKKQPTIAMYSTEAEIMAASQGAIEAIHLTARSSADALFSFGGIVPSPLGVDSVTKSIRYTVYFIKRSYLVQTARSPSLQWCNLQRTDARAPLHTYLVMVTSSFYSPAGS